MHQNIAFHQYLQNKSWEMTEEWYNSIDATTAVGVYASEDPDVIQTLKEQNHSFREHLVQVFNEPEDSFFSSFEEWINEIASDSAHQTTPIHIILQEFLSVQNQYMAAIEDFTEENADKHTKEEVRSWTRIILKAFGKVMTRFVEEHERIATLRLKSQQEVIKSLSAPVIKLQGDIGLLPLIGEIDTERAKYLLENSLMECAKKEIRHLYIDISGVDMIDTMVAMQIFQLIDSLRLIGVKTTLSGVRPEIALTAVQLGLDFKNIRTTGNLSQALRLK